MIPRTEFDLLCLVLVCNVIHQCNVKLTIVQVEVTRRSRALGDWGYESGGSLTRRRSCSFDETGDLSSS